VLWLHDEVGRMSILREMRDTMSVGERARLNSPISARQRIEKVLKARERNRCEAAHVAGGDAETADRREGQGDRSADG
jgi:hypothetical protein